MIKRISRHLYILASALLIVIVGAGLALFMYEGTSQLPLRQYFNSSLTNAVWDWNDPESLSSQKWNELVDFMYLHQLNTLYINVGDRYAQIFNETEAAKKSAETQDLERALEKNVALLAQHNIKVYAVGGDMYWSDQDKQQIPLFILRSVESYNSKYPKAKLAGVEFDVESYNQPGFDTGSNTVKSLVLNDWLDMVDRLATEVTTYKSKTSQDIELGFAIPYWYDNENGNIPSLTRNFKTGPTLYHLLDRLNVLAKSNVVVMDYRNVAKGNDGIIFHARTELEYAQAKAPNVHVLIGQEVNDVSPAKTTYYGESITDLSSQVSITENELKQYDTFQGIVINDLAGLESLAHQQ